MDKPKQLLQLTSPCVKTPPELACLTGPQLLAAKLAILRARVGDYPAGPEKVACQLTSKILKSERKVRAAGSRGTRGTEDKRQELYALCLEERRTPECPIEENSPPDYSVERCSERLKRNDSASLKKHRAHWSNSFDAHPLFF
jgi:hypothetical protein